MLVEAIVAGIELAAAKPPGVRAVPFQRRGEGLEPAQVFPGMPGPERFSVLNRFVIQLPVSCQGRDMGAAGKFRGRLVDLMHLVLQVDSGDMFETGRDQEILDESGALGHVEIARADLFRRDQADPQEGRGEIIDFLHIENDRQLIPGHILLLDVFNFLLDHRCEIRTGLSREIARELADQGFVIGYIANLHQWSLLIIIRGSGDLICCTTYKYFKLYHIVNPFIYMAIKYHKDWLNRQSTGSLQDRRHPHYLF